MNGNDWNNKKKSHWFKINWESVERTSQSNDLLLIQNILPVLSKFDKHTSYQPKFYEHNTFLNRSSYSNHLFLKIFCWERSNFIFSFSASLVIYFRLQMSEAIELPQVNKEPAVWTVSLTSSSSWLESTRTTGRDSCIPPSGSRRSLFLSLGGETKEGWQASLEDRCLLRKQKQLVHLAHVRSTPPPWCPIVSPSWTRWFVSVPRDLWLLRTLVSPILETTPVSSTKSLKSITSARNPSQRRNEVCWDLSVELQAYGTGISFLLLFIV